MLKYLKYSNNIIKLFLPILFFKIERTWIITEQAMVKSFGALKFEEYKKKQQKKEQVKEEKLNGVYLNSGSNAQKISKVSGQKRKRSSKKVHSMNEKEEKIRDSWFYVDMKGQIVSDKYDRIGNSSAACPQDIERIFPKLKRMGLNTVLERLLQGLPAESGYQGRKLAAA